MVALARSGKSPIDRDVFRGPAVAGDALHAQVGIVDRVHEAGGPERQRSGSERIGLGKARKERTVQHAVTLR